MRGSLGMPFARLETEGWIVATEVPIGDPVPRGWIDLLGYRPVDRSGIIGELKGDLSDLGELQRQVSFYTRSAAWAARPLGWRFERTATFVAALDSATITERIEANRLLIARAFPGSLSILDAWIGSSAAPGPTGPTLALVDPASRRRRWLLSATLAARRSPPAYRDYADAARRLRASRRMRP